MFELKGFYVEGNCLYLKKKCFYFQRLQHRRTLTAAQNGELSETLTSASIRKSKKVKAMIHQTIPHVSLFTIKTQNEV